MKNEAAWNEIGKLFDVEPKKAVQLAEEVERSEITIEPVRDERRKHQCHRDGCDSPAVWQVFLHFRYGWHLVAIETMKSTIRVCDRHRRAANDFILSSHNKKTISREMAKMGRLNIDWDNAMIEFVPLNEETWGLHALEREHLQVSA